MRLSIKPLRNSERNQGHLREDPFSLDLARHHKLGAQLIWQLAKFLY